jgi:hypothetical protein
MIKMEKETIILEREEFEAFLQFVEAALRLVKKRHKRGGKDEWR